MLINSISYDSWPIAMVKMLRAAGPIVERSPVGVLRAIIRTSMQLGHDSYPHAQEAVAVHWPHYGTERGPADFMHQVRSLDVRDTLAIADQLPRLNLPVRLVWGAADQFQKIGYGYRLAYELRGHMDRIEGGKHFVPEDHPDRVATAVNELLAQLAGGERAPMPVAA